MEFLRRHFEKVLLGLALLVMLLSSYLLMRGLQRAADEVKEVQQKADRAVIGGKQIEAFKEKGFQAAEVIKAGEVSLAIIDPEAGGRNGTLVDPPTLIRCLNPECYYLIPYDAAVCPFCQTELPPEEEDVDQPIGQDSDGDGIDDFTEERYEFLDPNNANDAVADYDTDMFTNLEEHRAKPKTRMDDPTSFPPLAGLLRFGGIIQKPLPITFLNIMRNNADDPERWDLTCAIIDSRGRERRKSVRLGDTLEGFRIQEVREKFEDRENPRTGKVEKIDVSELVIGLENGETYTLAMGGEKAYERDLWVLIYYLGNRYNPRSPRNTKLYRKLGDEIKVAHPRWRTTVETYTVASLSAKLKGDDQDSVTLERIEPKQPEGEAEFKLRRIGRDAFIREYGGLRQAGAGAEVPGAGEPATPGAGGWR